MMQETSLYDDIIRDILSRLPVKSLLRFKSVSKRWQSLIQYDSFFIDLHLTRSKQRNSAITDLLIVNPRSTPLGPVNLFSTEFLATNKHHHRHKSVVAARHRFKPPNRCGMLRPVNGLVCFYSLLKCYICVANITTGEQTPLEQTPWMKATLKDGQDLDVFSKQYEYKWQCAFGFDCATKEHKVISLYEKSRRPRSLDEYHKQLLEIDQVCEVMTLGNNCNTWRRIDEYPEYQLHYSNMGVYVNGSIYWISNNSTSNQGAYLIAFDVGNEKFRTIPIPDNIVQQPEAEDSLPVRIVDLLEVNGHVALIDRVSFADHIVKLWLFKDNHHHVHDIGSNWTGESVLIPHSFREVTYTFEDTVPGTDEIIIKLHHFGPCLFYICYYNWKKKTFTNEVEISIDETRYISGTKVRTFVESLLPPGVASK